MRGNNYFFCLLTIGLLGFASVATAQESPLNIFYPVNQQAQSLSSPQSNILEGIATRPYTERVFMTRVQNLSTIKQANALSLTIAPDKGFSFEKVKKISHKNRFTWIGQVRNGSVSNVGHALLIVDGNEITGRFHTNSEVYTVEPLGQGMHVVARQDPSKLPSCGTYGTSDEGKVKSSIQMKSQKSGVGTMSTDPVIDVLVAYTQAVANQSGNVGNIITGSIDSMNDSFTNSNLSVSVSLVHSMQVNYTETGDHSTAVDRLQDPIDGYMDSVHDAREQYDADVVVLLNDEDDLNSGGEADEIGAERYDAFAVVQWDIAIGDFVFSHEVGHLAGGRHQTDSNTSPFSYGHGYADASDDWETIMAIPYAGVTRLNFWSDPNATYGGDPRGTASDADMVRVWENRAATLEGFFPLPPSPPNNLRITSDYTYCCDHPVSMEWDGVSGADEYNVYRCSVNDLSDLCNGWSVISTTSSTSYTDGSRYMGDYYDSDEAAKYYVTAVDNGVESDPSNTEGTYVKTPYSKEKGALSAGQMLPEEFSLEGSHPNPFSASTKIRFAMPEAAEVRLVIYNALGQIVARPVDRRMQPGYHEVRWKATALPSGLYLYKLRAGDFSDTGRMVIVE